MARGPADPASPPDRIGRAWASESDPQSAADYDVGVLSRKRLTNDALRSPSLEDQRAYEIDDLDKGVISILKSDGRASNVEIARTLGVTEATIRKRIANLLSQELIEIVAVPTPKLAGFTLSAIMGLNVSLDRLRDVSKALVKLPEVRYCGLSTGRFDIMIEAFFSSHEHLLSFSMEEVGQIAGVVKVETFLILDISKFSYEWEIELP